MHSHTVTIATHVLYVQNYNVMHLSYTSFMHGKTHVILTEKDIGNHTP